MYTITVLFLLIVASASTHANLQIIQNKNYNLTEFAARAFRNYCMYCRATLIIHDDDEFMSTHFFQLLTRQHFKMSIVSMSLGHAGSEYTLKGEFVGTVIELTIIFWSERYFNQPDYFLDSVEKSLYWNRFSKIIIVASGKVPSNYVPWLEITFQRFWKRKILRVFICFWANATRHVYMFNPFMGDFAKDISNVSNEEYNTYLEYELLDLYGYPMKTYVFDVDQYDQRVSSEGIDIFGRPSYYGLDGYFITETRNILNVTLDLHRESQEGILEKFYNQSKKVTMLDFIEKYDFDIWFTAIVSYRESKGDMLFLHERDDLCLVVPTGAPIPQYLSFFLVVPLEMWLGLISSLLVMALVLRLLHRRSAMLDTYRVILNMPLVNLTQPTKLPERTVLASWIVFALFATSVFQCTLTSTLILPKYYKDIDTIQELIHANLTVYSRGYDKKLFAQNMKPDESALLDNIVVQTLTLKDMIAKQGNNGFLVRSEIARSFIRYVKIRRDGRPRYHIMREHPVPNAQSYIMPPSHPYYEEILWIINKVHESGLYYLWRTGDFGWSVKLAKNNKRHMLHKGNTYVPLSIDHLQSAFFLHLIGVILAIVIFVIELLCKMKKKKKRKCLTIRFK